MTTSKASVEALLRRFVPNVPTYPSRTVAERINHWTAVANDPDAAKNRRKVALQSLRQLLTDHPEIAAELAEQRESEVAA